MSKKILAMFMAVAMAFSLLPVTALAANDGEEAGAATSPDVVSGYYTGEGSSSTWTKGNLERKDVLTNTVTTVNKTAEKVADQDNQYEVTLTVQMKHKTEEVQPGAAATVLVIDKSGSMNDNNRLPAAKTAAINFLKSYSGFSDSDFKENGSLKNNVSGKNLKRYVSLVTFNDSASLQTWGKWNDKKSWIDVSTKDGYNKLLSAINEIKATRGTNLDAALRLAKSQMQSDSIKQIEPSKKNVIALTDGVPTYYVGEGQYTDVTWNVKQHGSYGCPTTNQATATSATALKAKVSAVYTVCFGAKNQKCWEKNSDCGFSEHENDGPTVGDFLRDSIATQPTNGSNKQYAYNADNAEGLYQVFAAITQTITEGLNEGVVTDSLPTGVTAVEDSGFVESWELKSNEATVTQDGEYNVYTYTKTYKVNVDPAAVKTVEVGGVNYAPLNTPTILTVQHNGSPVQIPFPIPAIRINITQATVTFKVKNGTWSDGETGDKTTTVTMINGKGTLPTSAVPTGMEANPNYEGGEWDTIPNTEANGITGDATYTYSFAPTSGTATVTFKVKNGTWSDETNADKTVIVNLSAGKGTLSNSAVPTGMEANPNYEGGAWDTTPNTEANGITGDVTYTYSFVPKKVEVKLSDLIKKELTVKKDSTLPTGTKFTVTVTPKTVNGVNVANPQPIPGTVSDLGTGTTNGDGDTIYTVPFAFTGGTLSLSAGTYTYTVQEDAISPISGMQYDSKEYTLTITVPGNGEAPYQAEAITIQNTYQTPDLTVEKKTVSVDGKKFDSNPVAHVGEQIIWSVTVTNKNSTPARVTLTDAMAEGVYTNQNCEEANKVTLTNDNSWTATVSGTPVTYYVTYTVKADDISKGKIVNTIVMKNGDQEKTANSDPVSTWDTKQLKSATGRLETSDWTTTVTLTLPTVNGNKEGTPETEVQPDPITAISKGSYVIDKIGKQFTFMDGLSLEKNNVKIPMQKKGDTYYFGENATEQSYLYKLTYTERNGEEAAQFNWEINENIPAETTVTLSYKLKLTTREKNPGTYGKDDLDGSLRIPESEARYTNESAILYKKEGNTKLADFPKPSVSYTISSGSSGSHSGGSRPSLNTKDHYGYIIGYPVDYYTGQPTTDQTKKPVRPEGKITRAEVATIYFRMLTDESRTKFWSQSSGYSDVKAGDWFNNAVSTLSNAGIIAGYEDGSFRPNGYITRAEFATIAARFFDVTYNGKDLFPDISGHWAKDYINQAANKGFVNGYEDGTFKPDRNITRAEAVTLVNRTLDRHPDKNHFTKDMLVWPDNMDQTKWYYADMQEATNSHTYQMKENSDKTKYENWTKTLPIRNWEALEKAWSNANSSQGNGNVV